MLFSWYLFYIISCNSNRDSQWWAGLHGRGKGKIDIKNYIHTNSAYHSKIPMFENFFCQQSYWTVCIITILWTTNFIKFWNLVGFIVQVLQTNGVEISLSRGYVPLAFCLAWYSCWKQWSLSNILFNRGYTWKPWTSSNILCTSREWSLMFRSHFFDVFWVIDKKDIWAPGGINFVSWYFDFGLQMCYSTR